MNGHAIISETPIYKHALTILALLLANTTETRDRCIHLYNICFHLIYFIEWHIQCNRFYNQYMRYVVQSSHKYMKYEHILKKVIWLWNTSGFVPPAVSDNEPIIFKCQQWNNIIGAWVYGGFDWCFLQQYFLGHSYYAVHFNVPIMCLIIIISS